MSFNKIFVDSITLPWDIILTSNSPKAIPVKAFPFPLKAKIEDYISKKYDEVALQH